MLELKKVTVGKEEKRSHICLPCPTCIPYWCSPLICAIPYPDDQVDY